jgi:hypothetical protein
MTGPDIVTTKLHARECLDCLCGLDCMETLSRIAVATLEDAGQEVFEFFSGIYTQARCRRMIESGELPLTLPDGTVIEVEQVTYPDIAFLGEFTDSEMRALANTEQALLDAFNAREAKRCGPTVSEAIQVDFAARTLGSERREQPDVVAARPCPVYIVVDRISGKRVYTESSRHVYRIYCEQEGDHGTHVGDRSQSEFDRLMKAWKEQQQR